MKINKEIVERVNIHVETSERVTEVPFFFDNLPEPPLKILDVGSCESVLPIELKKLGFDVWAVDRRPYEHPFEQFVQCDARFLPFEDNTFDLTCSLSVIEHIGLVRTPYKTDDIHDEFGDIKTFNEIIRVTKLGGKIIVTVPYGIGNKGMEHWVRFFNKERLDKMFSNKNFKVEKLQFTVCAKGIWNEISQEVAENIKSEPNKVLCNLCILGIKI